MEIIVNSIIEEEEAQKYSFGREGYDFIGANTEYKFQVKPKFKRWLFVPLFFFVTFLFFGLKGYILDLRGFDSFKYAMFSLALFFLFLASLIGFIYYKDYVEEKEAKKYPPREDVSVLLPLKKPHPKIEIGDKIKVKFHLLKKKHQI